MGIVCPVLDAIDRCFDNHSSVMFRFRDALSDRTWGAARSAQLSEPEAAGHPNPVPFGPRDRRGVCEAAHHGLAVPP